NPLALRTRRRHAANETFDFIGKPRSALCAQGLLNSIPAPDHMSAGVENPILARLNLQVTCTHSSGNSFCTAAHVGGPDCKHCSVDAVALLGSGNAPHC